MSNNTIAILLASNCNHRNTGMFSVDHAAYAFFSKNFPDYSIKFYCMELYAEDIYPYEDLVPYKTYNKISEENLKDIYGSSLIVYWSDFFHTRHFLEQYMEQYVFSKSSNAAEIKNLFFKAFFLEDAPAETFGRTISFGTSHMFSDLSEKYLSDRYARNYISLYSKIAKSWPRDVVSVENLSNIVSQAYVAKGCDPAFLNPFNSMRPCNLKIGLFLGRRTEIKLRDLMQIEKFSRETGLEIEWIPWMINTESMFVRAIKNPRQMKNLFLHKMLGFVYGADKGRYVNDYDRLGDYAIVITDTYHLSVNAIKEQTPVFCIGDNKTIYGKESLDLHDKKKSVLFGMAGLDLYYGRVDASLLKSCLSKSHAKTLSYLKTVSEIKENLLFVCNTIINNSK